MKRVQRAVVHRSESIPHADGMPLVARYKTLLTLPPHLHGPAPGMQGGQGKQTLNRSAVFSPESPSHVRTDDPDRVHFDTEGMCNFEPVPERGLCRDGHDDSSIGIAPGQTVFGLKKSVLLAGRFEGILHNNVAFFKCVRGVTGTDDRVQKQVARVVHAGGSGSRASSGSETAGRGSMSRRISSSAFFSASLSSARTKAAGSPQ